MSQELTVTVPNDVKLELNEGVITLKAGSRIYVPNGVGVFKVIDIANDIILAESWGFTYDIVMLAVYNGTTLRLMSKTRCVSGPTDNFQGNSHWFYNTLNNTIRFVDSLSHVGTDEISLPIAVLRMSGQGTTTVLGIREVFNGFGYIGSEYFATPNITGIVPAGTDVNGKPTFLECSTDKVLTAEKTSDYPFLVGNGIHYTSIYFSSSPDIYQESVNMYFVDGKNLLATLYGTDSVTVNPKEWAKGWTIGQYANSPTIEKLANGFATLFDDGAFVMDWYHAIFNMNTATGYGLDIWGKILNRGREFDYNGTEYYLKGEQTIGGVHFTAEEMENLYRLVLQITAMRYIGNASLDSINTILQTVFSKYGIAYVYEYGTMKIRYVFQFYVDDIRKAIIETLNMHPAGVLTSFEYLPMREFFGFYAEDISQPDQPYAPFDNKPFYR